MLFQHVNLLQKLWRKSLLIPIGNHSPFIGLAQQKTIQMKVSTTIWHLNEAVLKDGFIAKLFIFQSMKITTIFFNTLGNTKPKYILVQNTSISNSHKMSDRRRSEASSSLKKNSNTKSKRLSNLDVSEFRVQNKVIA